MQKIAGAAIFQPTVIPSLAAANEISAAAAGESRINPLGRMLRAKPSTSRAPTASLRRLVAS